LEMDSSGMMVVRTSIALPRDWRMRQPLPVVRSTVANLIADTLAQHIVNARRQMIGMRRCENAMRAGEVTRAIRAAEEAVALYPASTLARTCLAASLRLRGVVVSGGHTDGGNGEHSAGVTPDSVVRITDAILSRDTSNVVATVIRARSLTQPAAVADAWERVAILRPDSLELALLAVEELLRLQQGPRALAISQQLRELHTENLELRRLNFRGYIAQSRWAEAAALGDSLDYQDVAFRSDSSYALRHIEALRLSGDTLGAVAKSARSVKEYPGDLALYVQYVQLIKGEDAAAFPRGLAAFPQSTELHVLAAREAVAAGKRREALTSLSAAGESDTTLTQGYLQMAELWLGENQPDSAVAAIARAPRSGARAELVRTYAIARGRQMIRQVEDTSLVEWRRALHLFSVADSIDSREDSRGLIAATQLRSARGALLLASKSRDCALAATALRSLDTTAALLERGVGDDATGTQLREAHDEMRPFVAETIKRYCPGGVIPVP
jgi:hypothetical protein